MYPFIVEADVLFCDMEELMYYLHLCVCVFLKPFLVPLDLNGKLSQRHRQLF